MKRTVAALAFAALTLTGASIVQAAPAAPLPGITAAHGNLIQVQWGWRHRRYWGPGPYRRYWGPPIVHRHYHCWWARGRRWCRWW
jgi:hypothetical protein